MIPDVVFPSLYDPEEIGESSLDHALNWDQINPVRHQRYNDMSGILPRVTASFQERSAANPDFVYLRITSYNVCYTKLLRMLRPVEMAARQVLPGDIGQPTDVVFLHHHPSLKGTQKLRVGFVS